MLLFVCDVVADRCVVCVSGDTDGVGRCLVEAARNTGSDDNITAVVVFLRPVATIMEEEAQRIAQGQVSVAGQVLRRDCWAMDVGVPTSTIQLPFYN